MSCLKAGAMASARRWCAAGADVTSLAPRVRVESVEGGTIARVVLCRGKKLNVMDLRFFQELRAAFDEVDQDEGVRAAVLTAEGRHFTAGLDLRAAAEMFFEDQSMLQKAKIAGAAVMGMDPNGAVSERGMPAMRNQQLHKIIIDWQGAITSLQKCRVPVIAACHGKCIGGGVDLITSADIRLATSDAVFSVKEVEVGIVADLGTLQRLTTIVGQGVAREFAFTASDVSASRAAQVGLVNDCSFASKEDLDEGALEMARRIASMSPLAVQGTKEVMNSAVTPQIDAGLANVALHNSAFLKSNDLLQAILAFVRKQTPDFTDHVLHKHKHGGE